MRKNAIAKVGKRVVSYSDCEAVDLSPGEPPSAPGRGPSARGPPIDPLLTVGEVAEWLRCSVSSLNKWRLSGNGPHFVYVGRRVRYRPSAVQAFITSETRGSTSAA